MSDLLTAITKVRDGYRGQMKFCDIEAVEYFREFVRRIDDAIASVDRNPEGGDAHAAPSQSDESAVGNAETPTLYRPVSRD